jgi:branched-chain amino acid transport system permease protein
MAKVKKLIPWVVLVVIAAFIPVLIKNTYYLTVIDQILIYTIAVYGLNYITGMTGEMNLGQAGIFALGAYTSGMLIIKYGWNPWLALIGSLIMGVVIGRLLGWPSLRVRGVYLALTTIGFAEIVRLVLNNMEWTYGTLGIKGIPQNFNVFGLIFKDQGGMFYIFLIFVVIATAISLRIIKSRWGRSFKAVRDNLLGVESCGISVSNVKITAFTLCAVFGTLAGSLYAHLMGYIHPMNFQFDMSVKFLMSMMLGGIGSIPGIIIGTVLVTALPEILRFLGDYYWLVFSGIVMIFAIFRPWGIISIVNAIGKMIKKKRPIEVEKEAL